MDIVRAVEAACAARGQMVLLADTTDDPETELRVVQALHRRRVDGIVLAPSAGPEARTVRHCASTASPASSRTA